MADKQVVLLLCAALVMVHSRATPDGGARVPLPGPGLSYGGIPYGSMSGNVAEYFRRSAPSNGGTANLDVDFAPIEQWL